jgi:hypothetical protein
MVFRLVEKGRGLHLATKYARSAIAPSWICSRRPNLLPAQCRAKTTGFVDFTQNPHDPQVISERWACAGHTKPFEVHAHAGDRRWSNFFSVAAGHPAPMAAALRCSARAPTSFRPVLAIRTLSQFAVLPAAR